MSDYQRFVSYIYAYPGNVKENNVGFAKVEVRNGECRLDITLRGVYVDASRIFDVNVMVKENTEGYLLVPIGEVLVNAGQGKYRDILNPSDMNKSGYALSQAVGISIAKKEDPYYRMFSLWNDDPFQSEQAHYAPEKSVTEDVIAEAEQAADAVDMQNENVIEEAEKVAEAAKLQEDELVEEPDMEEIAGEQSSDQQIKVQREAEKSDTQSEEEMWEKTSEKTEVSVNENDQESQLVQAASVDTYDFEELFHREDMIDAFDDDNLYDCIEVSPNQLKKAMGNPQAFDDNSFMMHGYFRFHHLLLGRVQENDNNTRFFIGIPGMYCNRERYMASVFGFGNFKKSHRSDYGNPYFGYWYQEM